MGIDGSAWRWRWLWMGLVGEDLRQASLRLVNEARRDHGLPPLELDPQLNAAAQDHADDMLRREYFDHEAPDGSTVMDRYLAVGGAPNHLVGENIAMCERCTRPPDQREMARLHHGWMNSPEHRDAILGAGFTRFGFAVAYDGQERRYAVQTFAGPGLSGTSPDAGRAKPLREGEITARFTEQINQLRQRQGRPDLQVAPELAKVARQLVPQDEMVLGSVDASALSALLPERRSWRRFQVISASCGGCGATVSAADVERFVSQWQENPEFAQLLLDQGLTALGVALAADGEGGKVAIAVLAGP
jgi:uncharacterized protein YkwD